MKDKPIITVKEARRLLGKDAKGLDDDQIMDMILLMSDTARAYLKKKRVKKSN